IISVPTTANRARAATDPPSPLSAAFSAGGAAGVVADIESMLSVTLNQTAVLTAGDVTPLLTPVGTVTVTLPTAIVDASGAELYEAGAQSSAPDGAAQFPAPAPADVDDAAHRAGEAAFWQAVTGAVGQGRGTPATADAPAPASLTDLMTRLFAGP